jgi:hypothetical protein
MRAAYTAATLRFTLPEEGVRFRVAPQYGFRPEIVHLPASRGPIVAGPRDGRVHVVLAKNKPSYKSDETLEYRKHPPYDGPTFEPVAPSPEGHFDEERKGGTREASAIAAFAAVQCALAVWEHHFQAEIPWFFAAKLGPSLELIPQARSNNAWMGEGFLEFGFASYPGSREDPWAENFDAVAHETGHLILRGVLGDPPNDEKSTIHRAHEEAGADLVAILTALHFESVIQEALDTTSGLLHGVTALTRVSEWGRKRRKQEIRRLVNDSTLPRVRETEWPDKYDLSLVFSGAAFDAMTAVYHRRLAERKAISGELADRARRAPGESREDLRDDFGRSYLGAKPEFREALRETRDWLCGVLARAWRASAAGTITFAGVLGRMLEADADLSRRIDRPSRGDLVRQEFAARGVVPN